jgi:3-methylfumaryl-CoA hydratase
MSDDAQPVRATDVELWQAYVGRTRMQQQTIDRDVLHRFAAATGADPDVERIQVPLAHWAYFIDAVAPDRLAEDGHPLRGDFLPAVPLPRRMFAAASIQFAAPLKIGLPAECVTTIAEVTCKPGQSGTLVFVVVDRKISQAGAPRIHERQTIVYRPRGDPIQPVTAVHLPAEAAAPWQPGPVDLFRFSAVTFNAHRIHYDQRYARQTEGYPDLVVQGPFTAVKLFALARDRFGPVRSFTFRAVAPLFVSQPVLLKQDTEPGSFAAVRCDGVTAMKAQVEFQCP